MLGNRKLLNVIIDVGKLVNKCSWKEIEFILEKLLFVF